MSEEIKIKQVKMPDGKVYDIQDIEALTPKDIVVSAEKPETIARFWFEILND